MTRSALFVVDERPGSGRGHGVRSRALAAEMTLRGWAVSIVNVGNLDGDLATTARVVLWDVRHDAPIVNVYPAHECLFVVVDDAGTSPMLGHAHLIVNGNVNADMSPYDEVPSVVSILAGGRYALLRPHFAQVRESLVFDRVGVMDTRRVVGFDAQTVARRMACARVVVTPASMRALEAACVGTPSVLQVTSPDQEVNARGLLQVGAAVLPSDAVDPLEVAEALALSDLSSMRRAALDVTDGYGCRRVADVIEEMV